jgi:ribosomal protein S18 acetylase RimI-like enzyme
VIIIKTAGPEHARGIQNVFYKTWLETYPNEEAKITKEDVEEFFKDSLDEKKIELQEKQLAEPSEHKKIFVALESETNQVVGVCRIFIYEEYGQLQAIYVLPEFQRKGIGSMLWEKVLQEFGDGKDIIVRVATYNTNAIDFYKKLGFIDTGKRFAEERHRMPISKSLIPEMEMIRKRTG